MLIFYKNYKCVCVCVPIETYFGPSLTGPNSAPRPHIGSPSCIASTHFTTISPNMLVGIPRTVWIRSWISL